MTSRGPRQSGPRRRGPPSASGGLLEVVQGEVHQHGRPRGRRLVGGRRRAVGPGGVRRRQCPPRHRSSRRSGRAPGRRRPSVEELRALVEVHAVLDRVDARLDRDLRCRRALRRERRRGSPSGAPRPRRSRSPRGSSAPEAGSSSSTERAPVVITLTKSAPRRSCSRTARRTSSTPSASRYISPNQRPPGAVAEMIRPHVSRRGPRNAPYRIACRASNTRSP